MFMIDYYSKLVGSYLLEKINVKFVLNAINQFIPTHGETEILKCDNEKEFSNSLQKDHCKKERENLFSEFQILNDVFPNFRYLNLKIL